VSYFAVELLEGDTVKSVAATVCQESHRLGLRFRVLEVQGDIPLLGRLFVRFKADLQDPVPLTSTLLSSGRGVIEPRGTGYQIRAGGREAVVDSNRMHMAPLPGKFRKLRGPAHPHWAQQFG
jgi:hypothetical protein